VAELERADISRLTAAGWKAPTPIVVKARDGKTDLCGLMYPRDHDPSKNVHRQLHLPGPGGGSVGSRSFSPARSDHIELAELGFVVVPSWHGDRLRSKAFADAYYGNMGDNTLPDQIAGMRGMATRHAYIDITRAGSGGTRGGAATAAQCSATRSF
jgi:dipeptidyl aminopeptidase/acylaminoacyl peptidase